MEQKWKAGNLRTMWSSEENRVRKGKQMEGDIIRYWQGSKCRPWTFWREQKSQKPKTCIYCNWEVLYLCYPGKIWQSHWYMFSNRQAGVLVILCVKIWTVFRNLWPNSHRVIVPVMCVCKWSDWNIKFNYAEYPGNILTTIFSHSYRW